VPTVTNSVRRGEILALAEEKLFVLSNPYELDGHVTSHPLDVRGYAPIQCYLLKEGERALLVGTGLTLHQHQVLEQIQRTLGAARLSLIPSGGDFTHLCNARPIADRFGLEAVHQLPLFDTPTAWLNFRPEFESGKTDGLRAVAVEVVRTGHSITLDAAGARELHVLVPPLRLLPFNWLYDEGTGTMFTVDVFAWVWRSDDEGPWTVSDSSNDSTTVETVQHMLLANRYWWLAGADTTRIRHALATMFEQYEIANIAPSYGCALKGPSVVARHYQLLDDVLASAPKLAADGVDSSKWTFARAR
jgi:hypothetical protein